MYEEGVPLGVGANVNPQKGDAAVLLAIRVLSGEPQVLLTRRSKRMNSHSGEVALPGGKWELEDISLQATALREAKEEVGLNTEVVKNVQPMAARFTRQGTKVTPFVGEVPCALTLEPCEFELESLFWLPLNVVLNDERIQTDIFNVGGKEYWAPVYCFKDYKIWGFTARLLVDFANDCIYNKNAGRIDRSSVVKAAPEVPFESR